jgi:hypothetical protein
MKWIGPGGVTVGGGEVVKHGQEIPVGALTSERVSYFVDKGWIDLEEDAQKVRKARRKRKKNVKK